MLAPLIADWVLSTDSEHSLLIGLLSHYSLSHYWCATGAVLMAPSFDWFCSVFGLLLVTSIWFHSNETDWWSSSIGAFFQLRESLMVRTIAMQFSRLGRHLRQVTYLSHKSWLIRESLIESISFEYLLRTEIFAYANQPRGERKLI